MEQKVVHFTNPYQDAIPALDLVILRIGKTSTSAVYRKEAMVGDAHVMMFIHRGCGQLSTPSDQHHFSSGDVVCFFADDPCSWQSDPKEPLEHYWIAFSGDGGRGLLTRLGGSEGAFVIYRDATPAEEKHLLESLLHLVGDRTRYSVWACMALFYAILKSVDENRSFVGISPAKSAKSLAEHARGYMDQNLAQPMNMTKLATSLGVSAEHLRRVFREEFGVTPYAYLTEKRLYRAKHLLRRGLSVKEAALSVGYRDPNYFSRLFSHRVGRPPSALRKA